jgi:hydroxymethylglutaryl-CoA reductase
VGSRLPKTAATSGERQIHHKSGHRGRAFIEREGMTQNAAITYPRLLDNGDYYWSITLTSLIVGTDGGGTGLPTQRECLELLGCYGKGKARKLAEICAATVLAGEISLTSAVLAGQ